MNIFIEGIPGSGKSTLLKNLKEVFHNYAAYYEGDISPIELAWCSYMNKEQYQQALEKWSLLKQEIEEKTVIEGTYYIVAYTKIRTDLWEFYSDMEKFEIYGGRRDIEEFKEIVMRRFKSYTGDNNLFECSFFQNIIEELMLFAMYSDEQIVEFYKELVSEIDMGSFLMFRLNSKDLRESTLQIKKERVNEQGEEDWYPMMLSYLNNSPYGKLHQYKDFEDLLSHFRRRLCIEDKIISEVLDDRCVNLISKQYDLDEIKKIITRS